MNEFSRVEALIGLDNLNKIKSAKVLVIGIGGVGGTAITSLVRSGIQNIIIVDNDSVDITNINRQVVAFNKTIGEDKTKVMKEYINSINKNINVKVINEFIDEDNIDNLFKLDFDYVIDACDTIKTKKLIIKKCIQNNKIFISCMGTAKKINPEKLSITTLDKTEYDPLAKILRKWAKDEHINKKIPVVSSTEKIINNKDNILASLNFVPNTAGILCAKYIIDKIINFNKIS